jgi:ADP-heptose:LPS heptosyltransferase
MKPIVTSRVIYKKPQKLTRSLSIAEYYHKRNQILIRRDVGGLGDILMHRMLFENFKQLMPEAKIHFACPKSYHDAVIDHPFVDKVIATDEIKREDYMLTYNTTTACGNYESKLAPFSGDHRSDIWASVCGIPLKTHEMHIRLSEEEKSQGMDILNKNVHETGQRVLIAPVSAMENKNLQEWQIEGLIAGIRERGLCPVGIHTRKVKYLEKNNVPTIDGINLRQWMSVIHAADFVVSVDTSTFHCAGGLKKPLVGIFTFADGKVYGKYFDFHLVQKHRDLDVLWTCGPCYNWCACPKTRSNPKPCLTEITVEMILDRVDRMINRNI